MWKRYYNDANLELKDIDGSVASYFSDHFQRQLMSGVIMIKDYEAKTLIKKNLNGLK